MFIPNTCSHVGNVKESHIFCCSVQRTLLCLGTLCTFCTCYTTSKNRKYEITRSSIKKKNVIKNNVTININFYL